MKRRPRRTRRRAGNKNLHRVATHFRLLWIAAIAASDGEPRSVTRALEWAYDEVQRRLPGPAARLAPKDVERLVDRAVEFAARMSMTNLEVQRPAILAHEEALSKFASDNVARRWSDVLAELRLLRAVTLEVGEDFHRRERDRTALHEALVRLQARGITVAAEIITLLAAGLASGALARWRTLHEVAVTARFLLDQGDAVAERWLAHRVIVRYRNALEYERRAASLGLQSLEQEQLRENQEDRDAAVQRYGTAFKHDYGWAADALGKTRPTFRDIEDATPVGRLRPYYQYASHRVHAGSHGLLLEVAGADRRALLIGPTAEGLTDPAQLTAISLVELTASLLMSGSGPGIQERIALDAMEGLLDRLAAALTAAEAWTDSSVDDDTQTGSEEDGVPSLLAWPALSSEDYGRVIDSALGRIGRRQGGRRVRTGSRFGTRYPELRRTQRQRTKGLAGRARRGTRPLFDAESLPKRQNHP